MAFANPIPLTIDAVSRDCTLVNPGDRMSEYSNTSSTDQLSVLIRNTEGKPDASGKVTIRHTISIRQTVFATSTESEKVRQAQFVMTHYKGDDVTEYDDLALALAGLIDSANMVKLGNMES